MSGQLPLADDLWLSAHDTVNGRPRLGPRPLAIGLGAALLAELMFWGNITLQRGYLFLRDTTDPQDPALQPVFHQFVEEQRVRQRPSPSGAEGHSALASGESGQDVREWIAYLAADDRAYDLVVRRLSRAGLVEEHQRRTWSGKRTVFVPRDSNLAGWSAGRLRVLVQRRERLDDTDLTLAGLFLATDLYQQALFDLDADDFRELSEQLRTRMHVMLRELVYHAETAVGETVMIR